MSLSQSHGYLIAMYHPMFRLVATGLMACVIALFAGAGSAIVGWVFLYIVFAVTHPTPTHE